MTPGERIAQKRKELGLSQEALGEELGVSRQSVYKWESGNAMPDIDKLVTLSQRFGVTIGWLLGVEEDAGKENSPQRDTSAELTDTQLKLVEEIVDRYLAARKPTKRRWWPWVLAAAAVVVLANVLLGELRNLKEQYNDLNNSIYDVQNTVAGQIYGITRQVEESLQEQNNLVASYTVDLLSSDLKENTVTFTASATPRTYTEGMTAAFLIDAGDGPKEVPARLTESRTFQAEPVCELTNKIDISVVFITENVRETQYLISYYDLYFESRPTRLGVNDSQCLGGKRLDKDGNLTWSGGQDYAWTDRSFPPEPIWNEEVGRAEIVSSRLGLFRNQELLVWLEPCEKPSNYHGYESCDFYYIPDFSVKPEPEDVFSIAAIAVDQHGQEYVYVSDGYKLDLKGASLTFKEPGSDFYYSDTGEAYSTEGWSY